MDVETLSRFDVFPYRHRVAEVMTAPAVTAPPDMPLAEAARLMIARRISSLLVTDAEGRPSGIATERDLLRAVARDSAASLNGRLRDIMSQPVHCVAAEAFVYVALARMARLGIRHLAVVDGDGRLVGALTARSLLKLRAGSALRIGDAVATAADGDELGRSVAELPALARELLGEGLSVRAIAAVIAAVTRDATARAAQLAEAAMAVEGRGPPPSPFAVLVLGSAGRGESLLVPDQDNALIYAGIAAQDSWFAAFGRKLADLLNAAGIPYCKGGVMASEPAWRRSAADWDGAVSEWIDKSRPDDLLNVDIFFDFVAVEGDRALAARLRSESLRKAALSRPFLRLLAEQSETIAPPIGLFGNLRTEGGKLDVKRAGLFPLVAGARVIALKGGVDATSTAGRLAAARAAGVLGTDDAAALDAAHDLLLGVILRQQLVDIERGLAPSNRIETARLSRGERRTLKGALTRAATIRLAVQDALTAD